MIVIDVIYYFKHVQNNDLHFKSKFTEDGIRYRLLRQKESDRYDYLKLQRDKSATWFYRAYIYTVEQAMELEINFRENWKEEKPDTHKEYFGKHVFCQLDDWVRTEHQTDDGEYWVMQVLWRNENPSFPHIRTPSGTYTTFIGKERGHRNKVFDGADLATQYRMGTKKPYEKSNFMHGGFTEREKLLVFFIVSLIMEFGYYNKDIVKLAYHKSYGFHPTWIKVSHIMQSEKIMGKVAGELSKKLKDKKMDEDWVLEQLKSMGEKDYQHDPTRRERVVRLVGAMNEMPVYENQLVGPDSNSPAKAMDAETQSDLKMLGGGS